MGRLLIDTFLMMEAIRSSEASVLTTTTGHQIPEDDFLHIHRRENLKCYIVFLYGEATRRHIPEDGGDTFLRSVGSNHNYRAPDPRRRLSSYIICLFHFIASSQRWIIHDHNFQLFLFLLLEFESGSTLIMVWRVTKTNTILYRGRKRKNPLKMEFKRLETRSIEGMHYDLRTYVSPALH
jgi:hypothetical protein